MKKRGESFNLKNNKKLV